MPITNKWRRWVKIGRMLVTCEFAPLAYTVWVRWRGLEFSYANWVSGSHSGGPVLARVIRSLAMPKGSVALDLGVGTGMAALTLSRYFDSVIGVDLSPESIATAKRNVARIGLATLSYIAQTLALSTTAWIA
jgi:protein-L-isoaspartate O-methyltransferase